MDITTLALAKNYTDKSIQNAAFGDLTTDYVKYSKQTLTAEQQRQARENIGASQQTDYGLEIYSAQSNTTVSIEAYSDKDDTGYVTNGKLRFLGSGDSQVILTGIEGGQKDNDAATVGQLNSLIKVVNFTHVEFDDEIEGYYADTTAAEIRNLLRQGTLVFAFLNNQYDVSDDNEMTYFSPIYGYVTDLYWKAVVGNGTYAYYGTKRKVNGVEYDAWHFDG